MKNVDTQRIPAPTRLYFGDVLAQHAGPDLDVELDALLNDDDLPLEWRQEVAAEREELIRTTRDRIGALRAHIDKRHRIHADRAGYAETQRQLEQQREEERRRAEEKVAAERLMLDAARRRADKLGVVLEPIRVPHQGTSRSAGWGTLAETTEERMWRVAAPPDHPLAADRDNLTPTLDREGVELRRGTLRSCCEWIAIQATAHSEPTRRPGLLRRGSRETT